MPGIELNHSRARGAFGFSGISPTILLSTSYPSFTPFRAIFAKDSADNANVGCDTIWGLLFCGVLYRRSVGPQITSAQTVKTESLGITHFCVIAVEQAVGQHSEEQDRGAYDKLVVVDELQDAVHGVLL